MDALVFTNERETDRDRVRWVAKQITHIHPRPHLNITNQTLVCVLGGGGGERKQFIHTHPWPRLKHNGGGGGRRERECSEKHAFPLDFKTTSHGSQSKATSVWFCTRRTGPTLRWWRETIIFSSHSARGLCRCQRSPQSEPIRRPGSARALKSADRLGTGRGCAERWWKTYQ